MTILREGQLVKRRMTNPLLQSLHSLDTNSQRETSLTSTVLLRRPDRFHQNPKYPSSSYLPMYLQPSQQSYRVLRPSGQAILRRSKARGAVATHHLAAFSHIILRPEALPHQFVPLQQNQNGSLVWSLTVRSLCVPLKARH